MKFFLSFIFITALSGSFISAHASYYRFVCSSPDASTRWENGHNDNTIYFTYYDWEAGEQNTIQFDYGTVDIKFLSKKTIKKERSNTNCYGSSDHYYHGQVRITPTEETSEAFKKVFKSGEVVARMICHDHWSYETGEGCE